MESRPQSGWWCVWRSATDGYSFDCKWGQAPHGCLAATSSGPSACAHGRIVTAPGYRSVLAVLSAALMIVVLIAALEGIK
jgi:hypothetical protein